MTPRKILITCPSCNKETLVWARSNVQFCSYKCSADYKTDDFIKKWLEEDNDGGYTQSNILQKRVIKWFKTNVHSCEICGISREWNNKPLVFEIDHINGNRKDNRRSNLRYICPNCHSQTDTFRAKNIKKVP